MNRIIGVAAACVVGVASAQNCTEQWLPGEAYPGIQGGAYALTPWDPDGDGPRPVGVVAGGWFTVAGGVKADHIAFFDPSTGQWEALGSGVDSQSDIYALAVLPDGRLVAGGYFDEIGGVKAGGVAAWNGHEWQALGTGFARTDSQKPDVRCFAVLPNGELVAGGRFDIADGAPASNIAVWDGLAWRALGLGVDGGDGYEAPVRSMAVRDGELLVAGSFVGAGGGVARSLAAWDGLGWREFAGGMDSGMANAIVVLPSREVVVGGSFWGVGDVYSKDLAVWNGTTWRACNPRSFIPSGVTSLALRADGSVAVGGSLLDFEDSKHRRTLGVLNGDEWTLVPDSPIGWECEALTVMPNGDVIVGGPIDWAGDQYCHGVMSWNGVSWSALNRGSGTFGVMDMELHPTLGVLGVGNFVDMITREWVWGLGRWNDERWEFIQPALMGGDYVWAFTLAILRNGDAIVGGQFTSVGDLPASNIAIWDGTRWSALGAGVNGSVDAIVELPNGDLIVGGDFTLADGRPANHVACWDGKEWHAIGEGLPGQVYALTLAANRDLFAGGRFEDPSGNSPSFVARWDGTRWVQLGGGTDGYVNELVLMADGDLVVTGGFSRAGDVEARNVARWDGQAWHAMGEGIERYVSCAGLTASGELLVGAWIPGQYGGGPHYLWRWMGAEWQRYPEEFNELIADILPLPSGQLLLSGFFTAIGDKASVAFVRRDCVCPSDLNLDGFVNANDYDQFAELFDRADGAADLNHDGVVNGDDYDAYVGAFELGC